MWLRVIKVFYRPANLYNLEAIGLLRSQCLQQLADITGYPGPRCVERVGVDGDSHESGRNAERQEYSASYVVEPTVSFAVLAPPFKLMLNPIKANEHGKVHFELAIKENEKHQPADEHRQYEDIDQPQRLASVAIVSEQSFQGRPAKPCEEQQSPDAKRDDNCQNTLVVSAVDERCFVNRVNNAAPHGFVKIRLSRWLENHNNPDIW